MPGDDAYGWGEEIMKLCADETTTDTLGATLGSIVDLRRYPIVELDGPAGNELIASCQAQLADDGLCLLPEFLCAPALSEIGREARALAPGAHRTEHWRATPNGDPASGTTLRVATRASIGAVAFERIGATSPLRSLYESPHLTAFVSRVFGGSTVYPCADPLVGCMITVLADGDELGWHYDPNDGVVSLVLQDGDAGGTFEFAPAIRGSSQSSVDAEDAVSNGHFETLVRRQLAPGTLSLFNGHRSLHRVAPVVGNRARIVALLNYSREPGYVFSESIHRNFFGAS